MARRSERERHERHVKILKLFAKGYTIQKVAAEIKTSTETVKRDLREVAYQNGFETVSTPLLIAWAVREGWIDEPSRETAGVLLKIERQVLALVSQGYNNPRIAKQIGYTEREVRTTLKLIYRKLGVKNRKQAATLARKYVLEH